MSDGTPGDATWRRIAIVFAVTSFVETVGFGHFLSFLPILVREVGAPEADVPGLVGLLSAAALVVGLPLVPFWGAWADRYSRKLIVVRSAVVEAVLFAAIAVTGEVWQLFLLVPLVGLVLGNTGVMLAELTDRTPRHRLGLAISLVGTAGPLGFAVGPAIGGMVADRYGLQVLFVVDALLTAAIVALLVLTYHERRDRRMPVVPVMTLVWRSLRAVVGHPLARAVFAAYFLLLLAQRLTLPFLALYVEDVNGASQLATAVGIVAGGYGLAAAIGSPLAGSLADRAGYRRMFAAGAGLVAVCLVLISLAGSFAALAVPYAVYGVGFATATSMLFASLATGLPPEIRSPVLNLALVPLYLSGVLGSLLSTGLLQAFDNDLRPLWALSAIVAAVAVVPLWWARPPVRAGGDSPAGP